MDEYHRVHPCSFNMESENQPLEKEIPNLETIVFSFGV